MLKNLQTTAGATVKRQFFISDAVIFPTHPQPLTAQRLEIFWNAEIEFAPKFFRGKISELRMNRIKNQTKPRRKDATRR